MHLGEVAMLFKRAHARGTVRQNIAIPSAKRATEFELLTY